MDKQEHTPGPWYWYKPDLSQYTRFDADHPNKLNALEGADDATVLTYSVMDDEGLIECSPANGRLIAASPDLLNACEFAKAQIKRGAHKKALPILRAAIAKARP